MKSAWSYMTVFFLGFSLVVVAGCSPDANKPVPKDPKKGEAATEEKVGAEKKPANGEQKPATEDASKTKPAKEGKATMSVTKESYGKMPEGEQVDLYTLTNANGLKVKVITYGATIIGVETPDRDGKFANITLFRDNLEDYQKKDTPYFGCVAGRFANRIANGKFTIDGAEYTLAQNNNGHHLHGGLKGFDKYVWTAEPVETKDSVGVKLSRTSADGEEGYPGTLKASVTYSLNDKNELKMDYTATTDKATPVNLTNHSYWNLAGAGSGSVLDQVMMINADTFLPVDAGLIPLGPAKEVKDDPMDFTKPMPIGSRIDKVEGGYDHCYVLNKKEGEGMTLCAKVVDPKSGRTMEITTTEPAVQFYTGNFLDGTITAGGKTYEKNAAFCLETEHYPDSPNKPDYPSVILKPGETYKHTTVHAFGVQK